MKTPTDTPSAEEITPRAGTSTAFKLAEKRADGTLVLETEDGRMFVATLAEGVEPDVIKSSKITIKHDGVIDGVPANPVVTKIDR